MKPSKGPSPAFLKTLPGQQLLLVPVGMGEEWLLGWGLKDSLLVKPGRFEHDEAEGPPKQEALIARLRGEAILVLSEHSPGVAMPRRLLVPAEPFWNGSVPAPDSVFEQFDEEDRDAILELARSRWPSWAGIFSLEMGDVTRPGASLPGGASSSRSPRALVGEEVHLKERYVAKKRDEEISEGAKPQARAPMPYRTVHVAGFPCGAEFGRYGSGHGPVDCPGCLEVLGRGEAHPDVTT